MSHTLRPWRIYRSSQGTGRVYVLGGSPDDALADVILSPTTSLNYVANAHLIAAAPELLDAATLALDMLLHLPDRIGGIGTGYVKERLEAAILKAEKGDA